MMLRKPGKRSFFKYANPSTVLAILKTKRVRYSSPLVFNDPFDLQSGLHFDFDISTLQEKVLDKLKEFASATEPPVVDEADPWGKIIKTVREAYPAHGFPREKFRLLTQNLFPLLSKTFEVTRTKYQEHWSKLLPGLRLFCVSEDRDNLLMWAHYAQDHTGAVFEFLSLPKEDNPLSVASPIEYVSSPPSFFTLNELLDHMFLVHKLDKDTFYHRYPYYKSNHWIYEREWRVWYPGTPSPKALYEDVPIRQSEFASLYIGCKSEPDFITKAVSLTKSAFPNVRIYHAQKRDGEYELGYTEI